MSLKKRQIRALGKLGCAAGLAAVTSIASAGLVPPKGIIDGDEGVGDFVFEDVNMNGLWEEGEAGISGVNVNLLNASGTQFATTSTNSSGFYQFSTRAGCSSFCFGGYSNSWIIEFILPTNYVFTVQNVGGDDLIDSDALQSGIGVGRTAAFSIDGGGSFIYDIDAGMYRDAQVPVPATLALFGLGLAGLGWSRHKKA